MGGLSGDEKPLRRLNWTEIDTGGWVVNIVCAAYGGASGGFRGRLALQCDVEGHWCEDASRRANAEIHTNIQRVWSCDQFVP
jgi:hypothetical protein